MKTDCRSNILLLIEFSLLISLIASSDSSLEYDYYRESCPQAHHIIRSTLRRIYDRNSSVAPAILRLVFHDCFVQGCDASVLLDHTEFMGSEKDTPPNQSLKGFDHLDIIKTELEDVCPGVVSCADLLVVAARESVVLAGGPFYPVHTGRKDSDRSFPQLSYELPSPLDDLPTNIARFATRGFTEKETVTLLGAHSTGTIQCKFFEKRLYKFGGTDQPDPTMDPEFAELLRSICSNNRSHSLSPSSSPSPSPSTTSSKLQREQAMKMDYEGAGSGFGTLYYRSLLQGRGILFVDQQLTAGEETANWVRQYASDVSMFRRDFAEVMMKLSNTQVLTGPNGDVRLNCREVSSSLW
ncbi:putative Peroxidase 48 [Rutidosis leptorrhynchoides]|uniref:putative Peroxidase 48 n=1 Tax=Rutidosis leptorrhynchoides TaxID=125765 RepID=UPI003A9974C3